MNSSRASLVGQGLLWSGFLAGAFFSVLRLEIEASPWQTIPWLPYALSTAVGFAGVVALRAVKTKERNASAASAEGLDTVLGHLRIAHERVADLKAELDDLTCEEVVEYIDLECSPALTDFADAREVISNRLGMAVYAAVMTEFASGERYVNRAWSAAADGYVDEVAKSVGYATDFLAAALAKIDMPNASGQLLDH